MSRAGARPAPGVFDLVDFRQYTFGEQIEATHDFSVVHSGPAALDVYLLEIELIT